MKRKIESVPWHSLPISDVYNRLDSKRDGLADNDAQRKLMEKGQNVLEQDASISRLQILIKQLRSPLIYILLLAALVSYATNHKFDAAVIFIVVLLNSVIGFIQEWRAEKALEALRELGAPHSKVRRNGKEVEIPSSQIVPGDILILETGARVGADSRILTAHELYLDESALTGESEPIPKNPGDYPESQPLADRNNMAWMSMPVVGGRGEAIVVSTGMNTAIGEIAAKVQELEREETPLQQKLARLGTKIGIAVVFFGLVIFVLGMLRGYEPFPMMLYAVAAAVSAIPEGLPAVISIVLALGVRRMVERNAIVRRLPTVETLGSTTVICSDKTGTITHNQMTVMELWSGGKSYSLTGAGYDVTGKITSGDKEIKKLDGDLHLLFEIGSLANDAKIRKNTDDSEVTGNPTEAAILVSAIKGGLDPERIRMERPRLHEIPFSSDRKYMASLHRTNEESFIYVKGAPEKLLTFCSTMLINGETVEISRKQEDLILKINDSFAEKGLRVVAAAFKRMPDTSQEITSDSVEQGLTFVGLWGMYDPPRPEAIRAIKAAQDAGIRVVMITGDHAVTATAIAEQVGILAPGKKAVTGSEIDDLTQEQLGHCAMNIGVFARVTPAHKLKIMDSLKKKNQIVAMTGDGVNDAPALKAADIGIAMGSGTEVAKQAADLILLDDNFATIVNAVEEGRVIFNNLRRAIFFLITTNGGEIIMLTAAIVLGFPLPLTAVMILWINLVTDGVCVIPLGMEPKHGNVLQSPPRSVDSGILDKVLLRRISILAPIMAAGTLGLFYYELKVGTYEHAQTIAFTTLAAYQWFHALNARFTRGSAFSVSILSNKWLVVGISAGILLQLGAVYTSVGQTVFGTTNMSITDWILTIAVAGTILIADEFLKYAGVHGRVRDRKVIASRTAQVNEM